MSSTTRPSKRRRMSVVGTVGVSTLQCQVCHRFYERADHLNRHLDSHRNERSFRCDDCPAAFNRKDLLLRHQVAHARNAVEGQIGPSRSEERATKACDTCVLSKVKCDNVRPCRRCQKKGLACAIETIAGGSTFTLNTLEQQETQSDNFGNIPGLRDAPFNDQSSDAQALLDLYNNGYNQGHNIPAFFDQIMVPHSHFLSAEYMQPPPPDLTRWMPEVEWLGQLDLFDNDFTPTIDQTFEAQAVIYHSPIAGHIHDDGAAETSDRRIEVDSARRQPTVMQQSPWLWVPERNQHAFSEHRGITLDERTVDLASSPYRQYASNVIIQDRLSGPARDRIFQLVSKTARSQITVPSFPSADCLDKLIKVGIAKRTETDAWIHPHTFNSESSRPEYLTALVAAGCVCFGIPSVSRTGLVLQEIVRVALNALAEQDNSVIRDLQYLQASMLWLDIGAFCGYSRKMEIAESSLQSLVTGLRRAGRLDGVRYPTIEPTADDGEEALDAKWRLFVELESYKRLVYHLWEHDIGMTMVKHRQPLISYAELMLPLPAPKLLWLAPSAETWRARHCSGFYAVKPPSLKQLLQNESAILCLPECVDAQIARSAYLHGLAAQIWEHTQQSVLLHDSSDPSSQLWSRLRQQKLYHYLQRVDFSLEKAPAIACLLHQFLQMYLYVNLDTITRFAGKCGEEEAHRAYTHLQSWSQTKEARTAVCHAGQALRAARAIPPHQNRGTDSFIVFHTIMVLWTYSMMMRDRAKRTGTTTPTRAHAAPLESSPVVFLDDVMSSNQTTVDAFIILNKGTPCLHIISAHSNVVAEPADHHHEICNLRYPSQVMKTGVKLLDASHPDDDRETGPPLLKALCGLMEELGGLRQ